MSESGAVDILEINDQIINRLIAQYGGKVSANGKYWRGAKCPECKDGHLWSTTERPLAPRCDAEAKCGYSLSSYELFPDLFHKARPKPTASNPNATADDYMLRQRGFDPKRLKGFYTQEKYWNPEATNAAKGSYTVQFKIAEGVTWEKFIDPVQLKSPETGKVSTRTERAKGGFEGLAWTPPGQEIKPFDKVLIVEGIFDAISWYLCGFKVASNISAGHYPHAFINEHKDKHITWLWAPDHDAAGLKGIKGKKGSNGAKDTDGHLARLDAAHQNYEVLLPTPEPSKTDWNDLLKTEWTTTDEHGNKSFTITQELIKDYKFYGEFATAKHPEEAAISMWRHTGKSYFMFNHGRKMWCFDIDTEKFDKAMAIAENLDRDSEKTTEELREEAMKASKTLTRHASCELNFLYTQRNPIDHQLSYVFSAKFADGRSYVGPIKAETTVDAAAFRKTMANLAPGALVKGKAESHEYLLDLWFRRMIHIETVAYGGYVESVGAFVFPKWAMQDGLMILPNADEYIDLKNGLSIKSSYHDVEIEPNPKRADYVDDWWQDVYTAWGVKGIAALAYFTSSLMTTEIRNEQTSFTFLEMVGDAGTGKSTLIEFLWRLFGRKGNYEGFDPSASTPAFIGRSLASVSNIPTVFMEGDRDTEKGNKRGAFDWESLKKLYGGKSPYNRAIATAGNETYSPPFNSTIIVAQNAPIDASEAVLTRLCHLYFKREECNQETLAAARRLEALPIEKLSGYLLICLENLEKMKQSFFEKQPEFEKCIHDKGEVKTIRIGFTHGQLAAAVGCLRHTTNIPESILRETQQHIINKLAPERERATKQDHPHCQQFFEFIDYAREKGCNLNHSRKEEIEAYSLNDVYAAAAELKQQNNLPIITELKKALKGSRRFIDANVQTNSSINGLKRGIKGSHEDDAKEVKTVNIRCWHFHSRGGNV